MMWMRELADTKSLCNEIQAMVSDRTQMLRRGEDAAKLSALTRRQIKQMYKQFDQLDNILKKLADALTSREATRRRDELTKLVREVQQMEQTMKKEGRCDAGPARSAEAGSPSASSKPRSQSTQPDDDEEDRGPRETQRSAQLKTNQLVGLQRTMIREQDQQLDQLSQTMSRLKNISGSINQEITTQNQMLDDLEHSMDNSSAKLKNSEQKIHDIEGDSMCAIC